MIHQHFFGITLWLLILIVSGVWLLAGTILMLQQRPFIQQALESLLSAMQHRKNRSEKLTPEERQEYRDAVITTLIYMGPVVWVLGLVFGTLAAISWLTGNFHRKP